MARNISQAAAKAMADALIMQLDAQMLKAAFVAENLEGFAIIAGEYSDFIDPRYDSPEAAISALELAAHTTTLSALKKAGVKIPFGLE